MRGFRLALVCTSAILFASAAAAQDPYRDFRVPEVRTFTWLVNGGARWNQRYEAFSSFQIEDRAATGDVLASANRHAESEPRISDFVFGLRGHWNSDHFTQSFPFIGDQDFAGNVDAYQARVTASTTRYLRSSGWGVDAALDASYEYTRVANAAGQSQNALSPASSTRSDHQSHDYRGTLTALLGPGYGRVRDVTGVFDMQVLEQRLEATGRLLHPLSPTARQRLAELFSVSGDFLAAHDRPDRYLWREAERILREDEAVEAGTFDAWSLMRALEPATLSIVVTRRAGWRAAAAYQVVAERGHSDSDVQFTNSTYDNSGNVTSISQATFSTNASIDETRGFVNAFVEYSRPFGMRWQTGVSGTLRYGDGPRRQILTQSAVGLTNVIADRWVATASGSLVTVSFGPDGERTSPAWTVHAAAQLSYFFEDSWSVAAGADHLQARPLLTDETSVASTRGFQRQTQVVLALTYRPVGRFEAPGLHVSERLAPGGI